MFNVVIAMRQDSRVSPFATLRLPRAAGDDTQYFTRHYDTGLDACCWHRGDWPAPEPVPSISTVSHLAMVLPCSPLSACQYCGSKSCLIPAGPHLGLHTGAGLLSQPGRLITLMYFLEFSSLPETDVLVHLFVSSVGNMEFVIKIF